MTTMVRFRRCGELLFNSLDDLEAVHLRQHQVENDGVVGALAHFAEGGIAVRGAVDDDLAASQKRLHQCLDPVVIVDDEYSGSETFRGDGHEHRSVSSRNRERFLRKRSD